MSRQIGLRLIWKLVIKFNKMLSSIKTFTDKKLISRGTKRCGVATCCIVRMTSFMVTGCQIDTDLVRCLLVSIMDLWNEVIPKNVRMLVLMLELGGLANEDLEAEIDEKNEIIGTIFSSISAGEYDCPQGDSGCNAGLEMSPL